MGRGGFLSGILGKRDKVKPIDAEDVENKRLINEIKSMNPILYAKYDQIYIEDFDMSEPLTGSFSIFSDKLNYHNIFTKLNSDENVALDALFLENIVFQEEPRIRMKDLCGTISGAINKESVEFTKKYALSRRVNSNPIHYLGKRLGDIYEGNWKSGGYESGTFVLSTDPSLI